MHYRPNAGKGSNRYVKINENAFLVQGYRRLLPSGLRDLIYQIRWCFLLALKGRWGRSLVLGQTIVLRTWDQARLRWRNRESVECPVCGWKGNRFLTYSDLGKGISREALCPRCHGLPRHRLLFFYLRERTPLESASWKVLHISPNPGLRAYCKQIPGLLYVCIDRIPKRALIKMEAMSDITALSFPSGTFDLLICLHVLEHVREDQTAIRELARVLKPGGLAIIDVPIAWNNERTVEYGGPDRDQGHHRLYGMDFLGRLRAGQLLPVVEDFAKEIEPSIRARHGVPLRNLIVARKAR